MASVSRTKNSKGYYTVDVRKTVNGKKYRFNRWFSKKDDGNKYIAQVEIFISEKKKNPDIDDYQLIKINKLEMLYDKNEIQNSKNEEQPSSIYQGKELITLQDYFLKYTGLNSLRDSTIDKKIKLFNYNIDENLRNKYLFEITNDDLINFRNNVVERTKNEYKGDKKKISLSYASRIICTLRKVLQKAQDDNYLNEKLHISSNLVDVGSSEPQEKNYITYDALRIYLSIIEMDDSYFTSKMKLSKEDFIFTCWFLFLTGLRISEARARKPSDFKIKKTNKKHYHYLVVDSQFLERAKNETKGIKTTNAGRDCFLYPKTYKYLEKEIKKLNIPYNDYILKFNKLEVPITRIRFNQILENVRNYYTKLYPDLLNIIPELTCHCFRVSSTIYSMDELKIPVEILAKSQGHSVQMLTEVYYKTTDKKINEYFGDDDITSDEDEMKNMVINPFNRKIWEIKNDINQYIYNLDAICLEGWDYELNELKKEKKYKNNNDILTGDFIEHIKNYDHKKENDDVFGDFVDTNHYSYDPYEISAKIHSSITLLAEFVALNKLLYDLTSNLKLEKIADLLETLKNYGYFKNGVFYFYEKNRLILLEHKSLFESLISLKYFSSMEEIINVLVTNIQTYLQDLYPNYKISINYSSNNYKYKIERLR